MTCKHKHLSLLGGICMDCKAPITKEMLESTEDTPDEEGTYPGHPLAFWLPKTQPALKPEAKSKGNFFGVDRSASEKTTLQWKPTHLLKSRDDSEYCYSAMVVSGRHHALKVYLFGNPRAHCYVAHDENTLIGAATGLTYEELYLEKL